MILKSHSLIIVFMGDQKNIARDISDINGNVKIGDENHYYNQQAPLPKYLTRDPTGKAKEDIIGRTQELNDLRHLLTKGKSALLVNGMGGIGKTTLAQVYVHEYHHEYKHIAYIEQTTDCFRTDLVNYYKLITNLKLSHEPKDLDDKFADIINALTNIADKPNLLVIDNATAELAQWYKQIPKEAWHILITSRDHIVAAGLQTKEIGFLSEGEAIALFQKHAQRAKVSDDFIKDLVKQLEYHTLTIEILAKAANKYWTETKITEALQTDAIVNVHIEHRNNSKIERITSYLKAIFDASTLSKDEQWLLKQFVCLPSYAHDYDTLLSLLCSEAQQETDFLIDTLDLLANTSWLQYEKEKGSYKMHRIVKEVVKQSILVVEKDVESLIENLKDKLNDEGKKISVTATFPYISYAQSLLSVIEANSESLNDLQNNLAIGLKEQGNLKEAKERMQQALSFAEDHYGTSHPTTATRYSNLGQIYKALGDLAKAKELTEKAMKIDESHYGTTHPITAIRYSNLAMIYQVLGDLSKAKEFTEKAMKIDELHYGTSHPTTATRYSNLGQIYKALGDLAKAKELTEKAMKIDESHYGTTHPITAIRYSNLAMIYQVLGDLSKAKELTEKAMNIQESHYGTSHPTTAIRYSNLATIYIDLGDLVKAKEFTEKAIKIEESYYGVSQPTNAISYSNLGQIYKGLGDLAKAKELTEKSLSIAESHYGVFHPQTGIYYFNLGQIYKALGDLSKAKELTEKALSIAELHYGTDHPTTGISYSNLGQIYDGLGDLAKAKELTEKALSIDELHYGTDHPTTGIRYSNLGQIYKGLGNLVKAKELTEKALAIFIENLGISHPNTKTVQNNLDFINKQIGRN